MKPGARGPAKRSSYNTFVTIICFSIGLLGGYLILGSPRTADHIEAIKADSRLGHGSHGSVKKVWTTRRELLTPKKASDGSSSAIGRGSLGGFFGDRASLPLNVALGLKPPVNGEVSKEMAAALKQQQSDKSEQHGTTAKEDVTKEMAAALKQQQSDKSESTALTKKATEGQEKEALMKAQQSETSESKAAGGAGSARVEQAKSAVAGGGVTTTTTTTTPAASTTTTTPVASTTTTTPAASTTTATPAASTTTATPATSTTTTATPAASTTTTTTPAASTTTTTPAASTTTTTPAASTTTTTPAASTTTTPAASTSTPTPASSTTTTTTPAASTTTTTPAASTTTTTPAASTTTTTPAASTTTTPAASTTTTTPAASTTTTTPAASTTTATPAASTTTTTPAASTTTAARSPTTTSNSASSSPSPPPPAVSIKGVFPDANTWPVTPVKEKMPGNTIHTLFTSNGSPYQNIQARVMVGTYHMVRKMPGGERLVALTRILHRTTPDEVMDEIPTFVAKPLQPECDKWCWFPVADRANAVQQWIHAAEKDPSMVKAPWLLLLETDYVWVRPLPDPGDAYDRSVPGWSFGFDYIAPAIPIIIELLKERCPDCDPKTVPNSGPAPVLARFSDFKAATPIWEELSLWIETHEEAKKMLGWVREMYAWDIGVAANKLNIRNLGPPASPLISQPPHDRTLGNASMYHYTWGTIYKKPGVEKEVWMFDKRTYTAYEHQLKLPPIPMPPNWTDDLTLQDGLKVTKELHDTVVDMLTQMNRAIAQLPDLTEKVKKQREAEAAAAAAAAATKTA